ncbi:MULTISPECIES: ABC transporter permease [Peptoniphilus]|uniref:Glutathione transport system permease protein gsiC n=1 Tax=Peptoniphilus lacrimalis TaxID=33031 RepID=A0A379C2S5_9FIRM|nr:MULTISPECIES: ABC transporter permease [Peptoniphilus]EFK39334.1 ABC transporter, permease protein [Peptoniphilus sp. oral taxon 836 str. F0141]MDK7722942.1 ABC transporter permease [Peptoniphilus lacrimalis]MDK7732544.1 ABC transporter permease [Peptoniphilus lacrimalis]SUB56642.1 Glutathione transport system permease protein gsiC [Peptoniphilus lacrimalis]
MPKYILKRILILIPTIIGVSFVVFSLLYLSPGDAALASAGPNAPKETVEILRDKMGLNDPFLIQYGRFLKNLIFHFDLGTSYQSKTPVIEKILRVFPNTLKLAGVSLIFAIISGIILGIIAGINKNNIIDSLISFAGMIGLAMPIFWSGLLLIIIFSSKLKLLPASGFSSWRHMILPVLALGLQTSSSIMRMTRSSMIEVLDKDYIRTARAKGLKKSRIIFIHALKNAMIPIITTIGLQAGGLLGGSILTETVFSISGIGRLMVDSVKTRDYPVILGGVMFIALVYSIISIIVDILYGFLNPQIKME